MLLVKVIEQITLVDDAVAVVLSLFQVLLGKPDVFAQPPAADGSKRERNSVAILCFLFVPLFLLPYHITSILYLCPGRDNKDASASGHFVSK